MREPIPQGLAATNIAGMLSDAGLLLTNTLLHESTVHALRLAGALDVGYTSQADGDRVLLYERTR